MGEGGERQNMRKEFDAVTTKCDIGRGMVVCC